MSNIYQQPISLPLVLEGDAEKFNLEQFRPDAQEALWLDNAKALRSKNRATAQGKKKACVGSSEKNEAANELPESLNAEVGVAFSGGGVRSATFNLGVLQALASHDVLDKVGYISSVSGGSYINSWLASWISKDGFHQVNEALADHVCRDGGDQKKENASYVKREPADRSLLNSGNGHTKLEQSTTESRKDHYNRQRPISHLRHYSSYLTPHSSLLSSDVWTAVAAYVLRLAPNLVFVLLGAFTLISTPYIVKGAYILSFYDAKIVSHTYELTAYVPLALALLMCLAGLITFYFAKKIDGYEPNKSTESRKRATRHAITTFIVVLLFGPILAMAGVYTSTLYKVSTHPMLERAFYFRVLGVFAGLFILAFLSVLLFSRSIGLIPGQTDDNDDREGSGRELGKDLNKDSRNDNDEISAQRTTIRRALVLTGAIGAIFFAVVALVFAQCFRQVPELASDLATVFGPSLLLLAYVAMASVTVTMLPYESGSQEWLNRIWGNTAILTLGWTAVAAISLLWPQLVSILYPKYLQGRGLLSGVSITGGWLLTTISGILSAFSSKTSGPPTADSAPAPWRIRTKQGSSQHPLESFLARISPYLFVAGLLMLVSSFIQMVELPPLRWVMVPLGLLLTVYLGGKIDVNRLSLHNFYRFRLIECYLAASRRIDAERLRLADLCPSLQEPTISLTPSPETEQLRPFDGPFPIINCTLNVTKSDSLDLQKRRARNFIFTPTACGFTRYKDDEMPAPNPLREFAMIPSSVCASDVATPLTLAKRPEAPSPTSITLGAAMAISGAAQSPNQGSHTSPAVAALLTLANIRLGWWLGNPRNTKTFNKEGPDNGLRPMLDELTAQATDEKGYVYLSDGGHFENLGLYELVRRKCKLILLCDADCDPNYRFYDLLNAIELCQVDFGAYIELDTDPLQNTLKAGWCRSAFTVGTINYGEVDGKQETGTIVYLKSAVTRQNSMVVHGYDRLSRHFPHEPTTNQWFDETQFEAYRLLGLETANSAIEALQAQFSLGHEAACKLGCDDDHKQLSPPLWWNKPSGKWEELAKGARKLLWPQRAEKDKQEKTRLVANEK
jgi:hypothetical protein